MSDHYERCRKHLFAYVDTLKAAMNRRVGRLHRGACDGLIESFLAQSAYYPEWRYALKEEALERLDTP